MQTDEKKPATSWLSVQQQTCCANAIIDLHALAVRTNEHFVLSKKYKKLAHQLALEIVHLSPKCLTLKTIAS